MGHIGFILLLFVGGGSGFNPYPSVTTAEFNSQQTCEAAGKAFAEKSGHVVVYVCAPK